MYVFRYGGRKGKARHLVLNEELVVVRTRSRAPVRAARFAPRSRRLLDALEPVHSFPDAGVEVLRYGKDRRSRSARDEARALLEKDPECRFAGRVLVSPISGAPIVYTENFFVQFAGDLAPSACRRILAAHDLAAKRELEYARNAYFAGARERTGRRVFQIAETLLADPAVRLCHPELARRVARRRVFPGQWHLAKTTIGGRAIVAHASVEAAWELSQGEGIVIALIDDGVDVDHEELRGSAKIVAPRDVTRGCDDPRPGSRDDHGTACAGVACAGGLEGAAGVAPRAKLMPIRLASALGSQAEADAFVWAAQHGADVISCSWGPVDGDPCVPSDPLHREPGPLPDATRLAIEWAIRNGRNGRGCVITWAAGNGNESVDLDGYASNPLVIAVAACNDRGRWSAYSDHGKAIHCAFPSNDLEGALTPGIWTTDRSGAAGYNPGHLDAGDKAGNYCNDFGGTSSASPGVAGVAALVLARNPELRWDEVKDVIARSCDRIDPARGRYDEKGHSRRYGYGRVNARKAVQLALPRLPRYRAVHAAVQDVAIPGPGEARLTLEVGDRQPARDVRIGVDVEHGRAGDLVVHVLPPGGEKAAVALHDRAGAAVAGLRRTFDAASTPALRGLAGRSPRGRWTLVVEDRGKGHAGRIRKFTVELRY